MVKDQVSGKYKPTKNEDFDLINERLLSGKLTEETAGDLVDDIVDRLRQQHSISRQFNHENDSLLDEYWEKEYADRDINLVRARQRLELAIKAVGGYSLYSADRHELQKEVDSKFPSNSQRGVIQSINQLLKYLKKPWRLRKSREEFKSPRHLTLKELPKLLAQFKEEHLITLYKVAFGTGMRCGEIFAAEPQDLKITDKKNYYLYVQYQIDIKGKRRPTKSRKTRNAFIMPEFLKDVRDWLKIPLEERLKFRALPFAKITSKVSKKALGRSLVFHDLRHSYAIHLAVTKLPATLIKNSLGHTMEVFEKYYGGYTNTPEGIDAMADQYRRK